MDPRLLLVNKVQPFSGAPGESWEQWIARFETQAACIKEEERLHCLIMLLSGTALDILANQTVKIDYDGAKKALFSRFGSAVGQIQAQAELSQACQEPGESVDDFGDRLRAWGRLAHPVASPDDATLESTLVGRFLAGIQDVWLQERLCQISPSCLSQAIGEAKRLRCQQETLKSLRRSKSGPVSVLPAVSGPAPSTDGRLAELEKCVQTIQHDISRMVSSLSPAVVPRDSRPTLQHQKGTARSSGMGGTPTIRCYGCGQEGHYRRTCPNQGSRVRSDQSADRVHQTPPPFCLACGRPGHWLVDCRQVGPTNSGNC